ncbi:hypothetical protein L7F22_065732 [Adiantum nelumboides]|nr:hypothetical protein [Adiantum nelumboides]
MLPDNGGRVAGYAGAGVWGSSPSIDKSRGLLFVATGNNYQVPSSVVQCKEQSEQGGGVETGGFTPDHCLDPNNHADSIVAIELDIGKIAWSKHLGGCDVSSSICSNTSTKPAQCVSTPGPDYDFGQAPMVLYLPCSSKSYLNTSCIVVAAQKSGIMWALDCSTGDIVWYERAGPGSALGGSMWGSSTDGKHVFKGISNYYHLDFELKSLHGNDSGTTNGGGWVALDAATGDVKWAIANPAPNIDPNVTEGASTFGPVSTSHGIVWATSFDAHGHVYAIDSRNGAILWEYQTGATVYGRFSIGDSCVFVGNGYNASIALGGTLGKFMHAFCLSL